MDLGNYEGILPKKNQANHENYHVGERLKTIVSEVKQTKQGNVSVILSRTSADFVKKLIELEIPEIYDKTVQIFKAVREAGYRTKIAVYSSKDEIDPVGACVGQKGARIQNIIKELEGEKIDVLNYSSDPKEFIENALTPAQVEKIVITNEIEKKALAIVNEDQLSFAIGKRGLNIKLANKLTDWEIDIKTMSQAMELGFVEDHREQAELLFKDQETNEINDLEINDDIKALLIQNNILTLEKLIEMPLESIKNLKGFDDNKAEELKKYIDETFELIVEEGDTEEFTEDGEEQDGIIYYQCPNSDQISQKMPLSVLIVVSK